MSWRRPAMTTSSVSSLCCPTSWTQVRWNYSMPVWTSSDQFTMLTSIISIYAYILRLFDMAFSHCTSWWCIDRPFWICTRLTCPFLASLQVQQAGMATWRWWWRWQRSTRRKCGGQYIERGCVWAHRRLSRMTDFTNDCILKKYSIGFVAYSEQSISNCLAEWIWSQTVDAWIQPNRIYLV